MRTQGDKERPGYFRRGRRDSPVPRYRLLNRQGRIVGRTARAFRLELTMERCEAAGILVRYRDDSAPEYRGGLKCEAWEVVVPRIGGRRRPA